MAAVTTPSLPHIEIALSDSLVRAGMDMPVPSEDGVTAAQQRVAIDQWIERLSGDVAASGDIASAQFAAENSIARAWIEYLNGDMTVTRPRPPHPTGPYEKLLWAGVISLSAAKPAAEEALSVNDKQLKAARLRELYEQLAQSNSMQRMLILFCGNAETTKRGIDPHTTVQYGIPGTWFSMSRTITHNNGDNSIQEAEAPHVNLDLLHSLRLGALVEPIFEHEMEHAEKSNGYPAFEEEWLKRSMTAKAAVHANPIDMRPGAPSTAMDAEKEAQVREFLLAEYAYSLARRFSNAAEDNMCNQGVANLSDPALHRPPYPYDLVYPLNAMETVVNVGQFWNHPQGNAMLSADKSAAQRLEDIVHAINQAFFIRNDLCHNTPDHWRRIGIDTRSLYDANTDATGDAVFSAMQPLCDAIAHAQPKPGARMFTTYPKVVEQFAAQRNALINDLFERFGRTTFEQALEEFRASSLEEQIAGLKASIAAAEELSGQRAEQKPDEASAESQGIRAEIDGIPVLLPQMPKAECDGGRPLPASTRLGKPMQWGEAVALAARIGEPDAPAAPAPPVMDAEKGIGLGTDDVAHLSLGDGRSFALLRADPLYQQARASMAHELIEIARKFKHDSVAMGDNHRLLPQGNPVRGLDLGKVLRANLRMATGNIGESDFNVFRAMATSPDATPGELWLKIDFSGSMGIGIGSDLEIAVKSAAMMWDAAQQAAQMEPTLGKFRIHGLAWGNTTPTEIISPDMGEATAVPLLDGVIADIVTKKIIKGLHGGTDADGALNAMVSGLASITRQSGLTPHAPIGWVGSLFLTDGCVDIGHSLEHCDELLQAMPDLTLDGGIVRNSKLLPGKTGFDKYAADLCTKSGDAFGQPRAFAFPLPSGKSVGMEFPNRLLDWIKKRSEFMHTRPAMTCGELEATAQAACTRLNLPTTSATHQFHSYGTIQSPPQQEIH